MYCPFLVLWCENWLCHKLHEPITECCTMLGICDFRCLREGMLLHDVDWFVCNYSIFEELSCLHLQSQAACWLEMKAEDLNLQQHCCKNIRSCRRNTLLEMLVMVNNCHQQEKGLSVQAYADITSVWSEIKLVCKIVMFWTHSLTDSCTDATEPSPIDLPS